tara:strand:+ start:301 stop:1287 length:987 start_codon:yes stop_codon:yes gene_type:complete
MNLKYKIIYIIYAYSLVFGTIFITGNIPNIFSLPLSALEIANSNGINFENKSFSIIKHPVQSNFDKKVIGYSYNSFFSNEFSSSMIKFPIRRKIDFLYQYGGILLSINSIPDTRTLFTGPDDRVPNYNNIKEFSFNQYVLWINFTKNLNLKNKFGFNIFPHFYHLDKLKGYGVLANFAFLKEISEFFKFSMVLNSIPGSFTIWDKKNIEFYPLEIRNNFHVKYKNIIFNSSLDYNIESINIFSSKFPTYEAFDYSISFKYLINENLQFILSNGDMIYLGGGFIFKYNGIEIYYGAGKQMFDSISMFHQGVDFIIDLNRIKEWQNILEP